MKRFISLNVLLLALFSVTFAQSSDQLFIESRSKYGFDETVEKVVQAVVDNEWKVLATHDLQQTMQKNGMEVLPVKVFSICHPKHSGKILKTDTDRFITPMMPCRLSVYEKSDGNTYISRLNALSLASSLGGNSGEVMKESFLEVEKIIEELIIPLK